jgi:hypothetical protein
MKKNRNLEKHGSGGKKTAFFFCSIIVAGTSKCATDIAAIAGHNTRSSSSSHVITYTRKSHIIQKIQHLSIYRYLFPKMESSRLNFCSFKVATFIKFGCFLFACLVA